MQDSATANRPASAAVRAETERPWFAPADLRTDHLLFGLVLIVTLLLVVPPIISLLRQSVVVGERLGREGTLSLSAFGTILGSPILGGLVSGTLVFALGSTLVGLLLGGTLAWCTERTNAPFKQ